LDLASRESWQADAAAQIQQHGAAGGGGMDPLEEMMKFADDAAAAHDGSDSFKLAR